MDLTLSVRVFPIDEPTDRMETAGALGERDGDTWDIFPEYPDSEPHAAAFEQYEQDHLSDLSTTPPAPQAVCDGMVVVLETLLFDIIEDGVEYRYRVDIPRKQAICSDKTEDETGLTAERTVSDSRLADGMQRSADALDHSIKWLDVISPRSFTDVAEAAEDLFEDDED